MYPTKYSIPPCTSEAKESREQCSDSVQQCSDKMSVSTYITIWLLISTQISYEENNWRKLKQRCKHFPNLCEEILKQAQEKGYKLKTDNLEQEADLMLAKDEQQHWGVKTLNKRTEQIEKQQEKELEQQQQHQAKIYIDQDTILEQKVQESLEKLKDAITTTTTTTTTQTPTEQIRRSWFVQLLLCIIAVLVLIFPLAAALKCYLRSPPEAVAVAERISLQDLTINMQELQNEYEEVGDNEQEAEMEEVYLE